MKTNKPTEKELYMPEFNIEEAMNDTNAREQYEKHHKDRRARKGTPSNS